MTSRILCGRGAGMGVSGVRSRQQWETDVHFSAHHRRGSRIYLVAKLKRNHEIILQQILRARDEGSA